MPTSTTSRFRPPSRKLPPPLEGAEQKSFVAWFRFQYPRTLIFAVPNGTFLFGDANRRAAQMVRLKAQGLVPGIPDLCIPEWRVFIEMKRAEGGRLSDDQLMINAHLVDIGWRVIVASGAESAIRATREFLRSRV